MELHLEERMFIACELNEAASRNVKALFPHPAPLPGEIPTGTRILVCVVRTKNEAKMLAEELGASINPAWDIPWTGTHSEAYNEAVQNYVKRWDHLIQGSVKALQCSDPEEGLKNLKRVDEDWRKNHGPRPEGQVEQ